jgi:RNA polymerase sigma-70 factor (ECF subfamily)
MQVLEARETTLLFAGAGAAQEEQRLVAALLAGDEAVFVALLTQYHTALHRLASLYVPEHATAVVQATWERVLQQLPTYPPGNSLKVWIFRILLEEAESAAGHSLSPCQEAESAPESTVNALRFRPPDDAHWPGHWASPPQPWEDSPGAPLWALATRAAVQRAVAGLPPGQGAVLLLRDQHGWTADEVCMVLGITAPQQQRLLHRARSAVHRALEHHLLGGDPWQQVAVCE